MNRPSPSYLFLAVLLVLVGLAAPAEGQFTRWGNGGAEGSAGSFQFGVQRRLSQAGFEELMCRACAHYVETWVEFDEVDDGAIDRDVDVFGLGYRYYVVTGDTNPRKKEGLAIFIRAGLSRVKLEPGETRSGYYAGLGLEYPLTQSVYPKDHQLAGKLRPYWISLLATVVQNDIERPGSNLDYVSAKLGVRFVFAGKRDKLRAACLRGRREEVDENLTLEKVREATKQVVEGQANQLQALAALPAEAAFERMSVQDKLDAFPKQIGQLFRDGELKRPDACYEERDV